MSHFNPRKLSIGIAVCAIVLAVAVVEQRYERAAEQFSPPVRSDQPAQSAAVHQAATRARSHERTAAVAAPEMPRVIDINTASADALETLHGIGAAKAAAIIAYRAAHGPFARTEDIMNVRGIGPKIFEKIKDTITVGAPLSAN